MSVPSRYGCDMPSQDSNPPTKEAHSRAHLPGDIQWSKSPTLGVEQELQIVDGTTFDLVNDTDELFDAVGKLRPDLADLIHREYYRNCIEIVTPVCRTPAETAMSISRTYSSVSAIAKQLGLLIAPGGTHPFADPRAQVLSEGPRNLEIARRDGPIVTREYQIFSTHVHIGVPSGEVAVALMDEVCRVLPLLIGLTANSPYWMGEDTLYDSWRPTVGGRVVMSGLPPSFKSWKHFCEKFETWRRAGWVEGTNDVWWEVRPSHFGDVEIRVADSVHRPELIAILAMIAQCLAVKVGGDVARGNRGERPDDGDLQANYWHARRYGMDGVMVTPHGGVSSVRDQLWELVGTLRPFAVALGSQDVLALLETALLLPNGAEVSRKAAVTSGEGHLDLRGVVRRQVLEMSTQTARLVRSRPAPGLDI
jgi:glutamate---cysteine ligase / carboxylate-amine ligase